MAIGMLLRMEGFIIAVQNLHLQNHIQRVSMIMVVYLSWLIKYQIKGMEDMFVQSSHFKRNFSCS